MARDLDRIRQALGEGRMSYFGVSWGTQLGAVYRSMFPATIGRMWLDSVVSPRAYDLAYRFDASARATEEGFALFARWLAARNDGYGLGDTPAKVRATVLGMRQRADARPWRFSDLPVPLDGSFISFLASAPNLHWEQAGQILVAMRTAVDGGPAPQPVREVVGGPSGPPPPPPAGAPERDNATAGQAYLCNEDTSSRDFEPLWRGYRTNLDRYPVTGDLTALRPTCAGWTLPVQSFPLRRNGASLQMSGHRYEASTPYPWVRQMRDAIGGEVFTVDDFIHGSLPFVPECARHLVDYFDTGSPDGGSCRGEQPDGGTATAAATGPAPSEPTVGGTPSAAVPFSWPARR
ncbi:alpha/beta hydrolase [Micromonospora zhanjiangensis]